jgi:hypothetical protein
VLNAKFLELGPAPLLGQHSPASIPREATGVTLRSSLLLRVGLLSILTGLALARVGLPDPAAVVTCFLGGYCCVVAFKRASDTTRAAGTTARCDALERTLRVRVDHAVDPPTSRSHGHATGQRKTSRGPPCAS